MELLHSQRPNSRSSRASAQHIRVLVGATPPPICVSSTIATYRLLQPGQAFTVSAPDYHGYLVPHAQPV